MTTTLDLESLESFFSSRGEVIVERLDHWAAVAGDRTCLHDGETGTTLSYAEFAAETDRLAGNLARLGVAPGDRVSVFTTNSFLAARLMFAVWKTGGVYSPINFSYTGRLLSYQLDDTRPVLVLTDQELAPALGAVLADVEAGFGVVVFDAEDTDAGDAARHPRHAWSELTRPATRPDVVLRPDQPANIVYTSGTTGPAKGVLQPHRWLAQYTFKLRSYLGPDDVVYNDLPMYHVGGAIANVGRAVWAGCEVAVWNRFSPHDFWDRIASRGATAAILLDVMIPWLMKAPPAETDRDNSLNKVHMQPLPLHHQEVARRFGFDFVSAGFGQTESGSPLGMLMTECEPGSGTPPERWKGLSREEIMDRCREVGMPVVAGSTVVEKGSMGRPVEFIEARVADESDADCPPGVPGQLLVRPLLADLMMTEYIGKPEATAEAWRGGWFHTGDSAIRDADGTFRFVDRLGDRIRVRGENLSSFQVEDLLNHHPQVQYCAVFAIPSHEGDEDDIVAYVVPETEGALRATEVEEYAAAQMPKYMRPRHVRIVADIPRTPTNKIEKYKLRQQIREELGR